MYSTVAAALDGSPAAEAILPFIEQIAGPLDLEIVLLRVVVPMPLPLVAGIGIPVGGAGEAELREAHDYLAQLAARARGKGIRVRIDVRWGDAAHEIVAGARAAGADLIALATHGRGGLSRLVLGSVALAVMQKAEVPVLVLRVTGHERARGTGVAA